MAAALLSHSHSHIHHLFCGSDIRTDRSLKSLPGATEGLIKGTRGVFEADASVATLPRTSFIDSEPLGCPAAVGPAAQLWLLTCGLRKHEVTTLNVTTQCK